MNWQDVEIEIHLNSNHFIITNFLLSLQTCFFVWAIACKVGQRTRNAIKREIEKKKRFSSFFLQDQTKRRETITNRMLWISTEFIKKRWFYTRFQNLWNIKESWTKRRVVNSSFHLMHAYICIAVKILFISIWRHFN